MFFKYGAAKIVDFAKRYGRHACAFQSETEAAYPAEQVKHPHLPNFSSISRAWYARSAGNVPAFIHFATACLDTPNRRAISEADPKALSNVLMSM